MESILKTRGTGGDVICLAEAAHVLYYKPFNYSFNDDYYEYRQNHPACPNEQRT
jgi:hypothetical protein